MGQTQQTTTTPAVSPSPESGAQAEVGGAGNQATQQQLQVQQGGGGAAANPNPGASGPPAAAATGLYEQLKEAAEGNWIGDVDEARCLSLMRQMAEPDRAKVRADTLLMQQLAGALDEEEIVEAVRMLGFPLKWKAYWIDQAGETTDVPEQSWWTMIWTHSQDQVVELIGWESVFEAVVPALGTSPQPALTPLTQGPKWSQVAARSAPVNRWAAGSDMTAVQLLQMFAGPTVTDRDLPAAIAQCVAQGSWHRMTSQLPRGSALDATARRAMKRVVDLGNLTLDQAKEWFRVRFNRRIEEDAGAAWTLANLQRVWAQLDLLPDQDHSSNTTLAVFRAVAGGGGTHGGDSINLGMANSPAYLDHTVRHEVGHAVHDAIPGSVNTWLQNPMGMWNFGSGKTSLRSWIADLGGFPAKYKVGTTEKTFGSAEQDKVLAMLDTYIGGGSNWGPSRGMVADGSPEAIELWGAMPDAVKNAVARSTRNWYDNWRNWQGGPKGKYFLNYWYKTACYMGPTAENCVSVCRNYTAMSHYELFADCYAEYFADPAGYNDHAKWGGSLPAAVKTFFTDNVLNRQPYRAPSAGSGTRRPDDGTASGQGDGGGSGTGQTGGTPPAAS